MFYTKFIDENSVDQGRLFRATKRLLARTDELSFPDYHEKTAVANDINDFFVRKITRIRADIDATEVDDTVPTESGVGDICTCLSLSSFCPLTESDVSALIKTSAKKSCLMDPMPTSLVVGCLDVLLPVMTRIVNSSLSSGYFPAEWKEALVCPLLKKAGLDLVFKNLRPVSNLQFLSKLTEQAVFDQTYNRMMDLGLYPLFQSAYRKGHSTETALLKVQNDILMNMNRQHVTLLVLLDLSAAFDTVDHKILLHLLHSSLGITGTALKWFESYLSYRSQRVFSGGCLSDSIKLPYGVPQGSCLGPLLFTIYSSKLFEVIKHHLPVAHAYADDTQLYLSFNPNTSSSQSEAIKGMELCIKAIRAWMITDKLKLNDFWMVQECPSNSLSFPLVVDYNPRLPNISLIIIKHFHLLESHQVVREIFPAKSVIPAYRRTKNLKDILAPSKFKRSRNHDEAENCGCFKCNKRCDLCCNYLLEAGEFSSFATGRSYQIKQNLGCNSTGIIYLASCNKCKVQYVGSTSNAFKVRFRNHKFDMKRNKKSCELAIHFNKFPHNLSDFNFIVIEKIMNTDGDLDNTLLKREGYWAAQLRTLQPFGLNKRCEFRSKKRINFNVP